MKAIRFADYGGPEVLTLGEVDEPHAGKGQIRIKVKTAAVNPSDYKLHSGLMKAFRPIDLPSGLGAEAAGIVDEVGEGVTGVSVGDAVFGKGFHTFAEYALLYAWSRKPESMSFEEAAATGSSVEAAVRYLDLIGLKPGQTLLVSGAAGGVGSALVQLAKLRGLKVIGTATEGKHDYLRSLGATPTTYGDGLIDRVNALAPDGVDAAIDVVGSGVIDDLIAITGDATKVATTVISQVRDGVLSSFKESAQPAIAMTEAAHAFEEGKFRMRVDSTFPLADAGSATALSAGKHTTGKIVIVVD